MVTLKAKLAESKLKLKAMIDSHDPKAAARVPQEKLSPSERKVRRALGRFDRLQAQVETLEARVRAYEVGGPKPAVWEREEDTRLDPAVEAELEALKSRIRGDASKADSGSGEPTTGAESATDTMQGGEAAAGGETAEAAHSDTRPS
jgi:phage shock protein A